MGLLPWGPAVCPVSEALAAMSPEASSWDIKFVSLKVLWNLGL